MRNSCYGGMGGQGNGHINGQNTDCYSESGPYGSLCQEKIPPSGFWAQQVSRNRETGNFPRQVRTETGTLNFSPSLAKPWTASLSIASMELARPEARRAFKSPGRKVCRLQVSTGSIRAASWSPATSRNRPPWQVLTWPQFPLRENFCLHLSRLWDLPSITTRLWCSCSHLPFLLVWPVWARPIPNVASGRHGAMEISVCLPHSNALIPGIGRFYTRGSNSAWEPRSETVSTNLSVQEGVTAGRTQSPFVIPQHPEPKTINLLDLLSSLGPNPLRVNEDHTYVSQVGYITMHGPQH